MIDRYGIHIGDLLYIRFYALIIISGAILASMLAARRASQYKQDPEKVWDILTWVLIGGILGARLWHILTPPPSLVAQGIDTWYYLTHPLEALMIWNGGLGIVGAVIGGALALWIYTRKTKLSFVTWIDIVAPGLLMAQGIGRWGNFINQELYGPPTDLPWAIYIDEAHRLPELMDKAYYHPTFLYESIWNFVGVVLLIWASKRFITWLRGGDLFAFYVIWYAIIRVALEMIRLDSSTVAGLNANQYFMVAMAVLAAGYIVWNHRRALPPPPVVVEEAQESKPAEDLPS